MDTAEVDARAIIQAALPMDADDEPFMIQDEMEEPPIVERIPPKDSFSTRKKDSLMDCNERMDRARQDLMLRLSEEERYAYFDNLKNWFRRNTTREEFDERNRAIMNPHELELQNKFIVTVMNRITASGTTFEDLTEISTRRRIRNNVGTTYGKKVSKKGPKGARCDDDNLEDDVVTHRTKDMKGESVVFHPVDLYSYAPDEDYPDSGLLCMDPSLSQPRKAVQELFLPDPGSILGRLLVAAWEQELTIIDDDVRDYIVMAVQLLLKNILTGCIRMKKTARTTEQGQFFYDVGWPKETTRVRNAVQHVDFQESLLERFAKHVQPYDYPAIEYAETLEPTIKMQHLYVALKDRNIIPAHSTRSIAMERIAARLPTQ